MRETSSSSIYAATCNPPRSAKQHMRPRSPSESSASEYTPESEPRRTVPLSPKLTKAAVGVEPVPPPSTTGAKRGRKPAAMSRTAREAQRKLNHSIIEKARRTKINDALATLKTLVPPNYGQQLSAPTDDVDGDEDEYDASGKKAQKKPGKREEKEKEFKLEILVRTVAYMEDLIDRVAVLEASASASCAHCSGPSGSTLKRKRSPEEKEDPAPKRSSHERSPVASPSLLAGNTAYTGAPLPSISSWLPQIDPSLSAPVRASPAVRATPDSEFTSHLPSPPASTHVAPARAPAQLPPALSLGPVASPVPPASSNLHSLLTTRTPEDERAASLLLEISASSPTATYRDMPAIPPKSTGAASTSSAPQRQVQTPSSLLGLVGTRR